jgi:hypothetical protein
LHGHLHLWLFVTSSIYDYQSCDKISYSVE